MLSPSILTHDLNAAVCGCGWTHAQHAADGQFKAACQTAATAWPLPPGDYLTGAPDEHGWHAVARKDAEAVALWLGHDLTYTLCGRLGRRADKYGRWDPAALSRCCPDCEWLVAAATGQLDEAVARLVPGDDDRAILETLMPAPLIAADAAVLVIAADEGIAEPGDEHPLTRADIQLLATITRHAPVLLYARECLDGDCGGEHPGTPGDRCPALVACPACSLRNPDGSGDEDGGYRNEYIITAPCQILTRIRAAVSGEDGASISLTPATSPACPNAGPESQSSRNGT